MSKIIMRLAIALTFNLSFITYNFSCAQTCSPTGACPINDTNSTGGLYPSSTFSTSSSSWTTVSAYMNAGNYTLFDVTSGNTYQWTYCSTYGGLENWNAALSLYDKATGAALCYNDNSGLSGCPNAPFISWKATFTGTVKLLTTISTCSISNSGSAPWSTLVWRDSSGTPSPYLYGIDVSSYQGGSINWTDVKAQGITFAWAKATEGLETNGYAPDADYVYNATHGIAAGVYMGAYHFAHPNDGTTTAEAIAEANYFLSKAKPYITTCQLPPALDYETDVSGSPYNMTSAQQGAWIEAWMNTVKDSTGIMPILYTYGSLAQELPSSLASYCNLWIATENDLNSVTPPATAPPAPSAYDMSVWNPNWTFNQYYDSVIVNGIPPGGVDADVFNGDLAALKTLMGCPNTTGIDQKVLDNAFNMYPNPSSNSFHIDYAGINGEALVNVYDINGKLVLTQNMTGKTIIDASSLNDGIYNVNITNSDGVVNKRLIIAR
jgi:GH25 family lysozyme M1 (1,4-beta-N-acetylmuramidase)